MPSQPPFDLYEALELPRDASTQDITSSYRRLAREHHPDKNPNNPHATARMQEINTAYGTLSNAALRADYDTPSSTPSSRGYSGHNFWDEDDAEEEYYYSDGEDEAAEAAYYAYLRSQARGRNHSFFGFGGFSFSSGSDYFRGPTESELRELAEERAREMAEDKAKKEAFRKKYRQERDKVENERRARAERKKKEEETKVLEKENRATEEKQRQLDIWESANATTAAEKRASCLHSEFWPRQQMKTKFKCMGCSQKRGPSAFKCPYCSTLHCQACLNDFNAARATS